MLAAEQWKTLANFLRDSAKITFGSLVIGTLLPSDIHQFSIVAFWGGLALTVTFLAFAMYLAKFYAQHI